jgi:peptidoglycan/LPS O-acetylase OafA/YrhL
MASSPNRLPSLDGLRAVSIALVIFSHLLGTKGFPMGERSMGAAGDIGYLGVRVFFVISGYLITSLLIHEHARTGTISLTGFYVRRIFRIFPAFYAFILAMAIADLLGAVDLHARDVIHAITYTTNYHHDQRSWELGHIWSLSIEEQFYLIWPALFLLAGRRHVGKVAIALVVLSPVIRAAAWFATYDDDILMEWYPCVMDAIAFGSVLAAYRPQLDASAAYQRFLRGWMFWAVPVIVLIANAPIEHGFQYVLNISVMNAGIAVMVDRFTRVDEGPVFRLLNHRALAFVGVLSYSLYLWQEPFLNHNAHTSFTAWPINLGLAIVCAVASYYLVEQPFLRLRDAWSAKRRAARGATTPP